MWNYLVFLNIPSEIMENKQVHPRTYLSEKIFEQNSSFWLIVWRSSTGMVGLTYSNDCGAH